MNDIGATPPDESTPSTGVELGAASAAAGPAPVSADLANTVSQIDRSIKQRRDTDAPLINWWLYFLVLSWVTLGIYGIYLFFKRISRIDSYSERKRTYYEGVLEWTERVARQRGKEDAVHHQIQDLRGDVANAYKNDLRPIKAGLSFLLTLVTLGLYGLYVLYRMNKYWWDAQVLEQDFDDKLSQTWISLGLVRYPLTFQVDQSKRRSYAMYLILSIITFGIWGAVWDYKIHTDPDNIYNDLHGVEDSVLQTIRAA